MEKICQTCYAVFIPKDDRPNRPAKFCSRKCIRNKTQFKKGHELTPIGNRYWDNQKTRKSWWKKGEKPPYSHFKKGMIPWNKGKDFGSTEYIAKRISWLNIYRKWKKEIKERDIQCINCGSRERLNIDHYPISLAELIRKYNVKKPQEAKQYKEFWETNNGRVLCEVCHKLTETYGRNFVQKM